jgi:hypothetical protein
MIVYRVRNYKTIEFNEYLFICDATNRLCLPSHLPKRFQNRTIEKTDHVCKVTSSPFTDIRLISRHDISHSSGIWLTSSDCLLRGGYLDSQVASRTFFSFPIDELSAKTILKFDGNPEYPLSLYHGTSTDAVSSIIKHGFTATFGMLGHGVYFGTFWKAARFAYMTQEYQIREGYIFRVLIFPKTMANFPRPQWCCHCEKCLLHSYAAKISDHESFWRLENDCAFAKPTEGEGFKKDGSKKFLLKNEEWAYNENNPIIITDYAKIDESSVLRDNYDPEYRGVKII